MSSSQKLQPAQQATTTTYENPCLQQDFFFVLCTLSVQLCSDCPGFVFCPLLYNTNNTNIHYLGGIQTRNPSRRAVIDLRLRPRGYRNLLDTKRQSKESSVKNLCYRPHGKRYWHLLYFFFLGTTAQSEPGRHNDEFSRPHTYTPTTAAGFELSI